MIDNNFSFIMLVTKGLLSMDQEQKPNLADIQLYRSKYTHYPEKISHLQVFR
jgi:hypothetical protein